MFGASMGELFDLSRSLSASEPVWFESPARYTTASSLRLIQSARSRTRHQTIIRLAAPVPIMATGCPCRDQDHRRTLQSLLSGRLPRADRHHIGLRSGLNAILPGGRAAAR